MSPGSQRHNGLYLVSYLKTTFQIQGTGRDIQEFSASYQGSTTAATGLELLLLDTEKQGQTGGYGQKLRFAEMAAKSPDMAEGQGNTTPVFPPTSRPKHFVNFNMLKQRALFCVTSQVTAPQQEWTLHTF